MLELISFFKLLIFLILNNIIKNKLIVVKEIKKSETLLKNIL